MEINKLAVLAKNGDVQAFEEIYEQFSSKIFNYIRMKIQHRQEAEDILQEVFIKSYKGLGSLRPGKLNFPAWLYTIAGNTINDHLRKHYRQPEMVNIDDCFDISAGQSPHQELMAKSDLETAAEYFNELPERHRKVIDLRFFKELSVNETALELNSTSLAVRIVQYRARKKLRDLMEKAESVVEMAH